MAARTGQRLREHTRKFYESLIRALIRYAEAEFGLQAIQHGSPIRDHLREVERQTGRRIPELHPKPPPKAVAYLWQWFMELSPARTVGMAVGPISHQEIVAWAALTGRRPTPSEIMAIRRIDAAYLNHLSKQSATPSKN